MYDVPVAGKRAQPLAERLDRVTVLVGLTRGGVRLRVGDLLGGHGAADGVELDRLVRGGRLVGGRSRVACDLTVVRLQVARSRVLRAAERVVLVDRVRPGAGVRRRRVERLVPGPRE